MGVHKKCDTKGLIYYLNRRGEGREGYLRETTDVLEGRKGT